MFDVFGSVKSLIKLSTVNIDNNVFRLHYKGTVILLLAFSALVTSRQYIGDPIDCLVDEIPHDVMDTYCWIYSTFTLPGQLMGRLGKDVIHPGVAPYTPGEDSVKYHKYYQWVCFVLFFQAVLCYIPHYLWKVWEAGRLAKLVLELKAWVAELDTRRKETLKIPSKILDLVKGVKGAINEKSNQRDRINAIVDRVVQNVEKLQRIIINRDAKIDINDTALSVAELKRAIFEADPKEDRCISMVKEASQLIEELQSLQDNVIVDYFTKNRHNQKYYFYQFVFCEILNLVNVIGQIYFMDYFLDGEFSTYGWDVFQFTDMSPEDREDPMARVFPKVAKCTFHKYGPSGTVQKFDGLCVLPVNIVNEKIYAFLWFWFVILSIITGLYLIYRLATLVSKWLRERNLRSCIYITTKEQISNVEKVASLCDVGDWFVLYQLGKTSDPLHFTELIKEFSIHLAN